MDVEAVYISRLLHPNISLPRILVRNPQESLTVEQPEEDERAHPRLNQLGGITIVKHIRQAQAEDPVCQRDMLKSRRLQNENENFALREEMIFQKRETLC